MGVHAVPSRLVIVWRMGSLRCEDRKAPDRVGHLRLYEGPLLRRVRPAWSADEVRCVAALWRSNLPEPSGAERRRADRRRSRPWGGEVPIRSTLRTAATRSVPFPSEVDPSGAERCPGPKLPESAWPAFLAHRQQMRFSAH